MTTVYTLGHSNRSVAALIEILLAHDIGLLLDIRAFPRSRRHPHFNRSILEGTLAGRDLGYRWSGDTLGGFRKPRSDSPHTALLDVAFRGFADYMESENLHGAVREMLDLTTRHRVAVMCAEADYRHCHRQFIADHLSSQSVDVIHLSSTGPGQHHRLHACLDNTCQPAVYNKHQQGDLFA